MSRFSQTTMLVTLNLRSWGARREDKKISAEVAQQHGATSDAGKYNKMLVAKRYLEPISKADTEIRAAFSRLTLPWLHDGVSVIPTAMYETAKRDLGVLFDKRDTAVRHFCSIFRSEIIPEARRDLNGMFSESDYPVDIESRFGARLKFMPVPDAADFRVDISDLERETLQAEIAATLQDASQAAMREVWERAMEPVKLMAEKLAAYRVVNVDGKLKSENVFRDSLVDNLRDICDLLPKLNFAGDSRLDAIRQRIESTLLQHSAGELRDDSRVRADVAAQASEIAAQMAEFMAG